MVVLTGTRDQENVYLQVVWFENNHVIGSEDTMNVCDLLSSTLKPCNYYSDDVNVYNNMLHTHTHTHTLTHTHTHTHIFIVVLGIWYTTLLHWLSENMLNFLLLHIQRQASITVCL